MTTVHRVPPTAQGALDQVPFAHLLVYMAEKRLTGTIVLTPPGASEADACVIYFVDGEVAQVRRAGGPRDIEQCVTLADATTFAFFDGVNLLSPQENRPPSRDPLPTIWSVVNARGIDRVVEATLARLGSKALKLHELSRPERFGFAPGELGLVSALRAVPRSLGDLVRATQVSQDTVKLVIYALLITRHLDHGSAEPVGLHRADDREPEKDATPASGGKVAIARVKLATKRAEAERHPSSSRMPRVLSPELLARQKQIVERAEQIDREDYFTMLGLERTAVETDVEAAYYAMVKTWHPDRLPPELSQVRDSTSKVFARITEAFQTLSDAARRKRYLDVLRGGGGTPEEADKMQQIIDAATDFQRGEILWRNRDPNAEKFIVRAYHADPEQSDYIALYASFQLSKRAADASLDDLVKLCDRAIERNERCERAYFCRAQIKKKLGKIDAAMADFRHAFQLNPKNLDAGREVRLHEMRRAKQPDRRSSSAPRRSTPPGAQSKSNPPRVSSKPPRTGHSSQPAKSDKDGGVFSGIGKLFKR